MKAGGIEVATIRWGMPGSGYETTDTAWITLTELPNADLLIVQHIMGPSTQQAYGSYDYELSIQIAGSDRALFTAMILSITLDNQGSIVDLEDLKLQCHEWDVAFVESERAVS